jgi:coenzyme PQQ biosynthesis protein PqqD
VTVSLDARPKLAPMARLQWDARDEKHMILSPERGLALNPTATRIVELCDGERTVSEVVDQLAQGHVSSDRERIERDVVAFLERLHARALLVVAP